MTGELVSVARVSCANPRHASTCLTRKKPIDLFDTNKTDAARILYYEYDWRWTKRYGWLCPVCRADVSPRRGPQRPHVRLVRRFHFECADCNGMDDAPEHLSAAVAEEAHRIVREKGWVKNRKGQWVGPKCRP